jgi:hypothetical protein
MGFAREEPREILGREMDKASVDSDPKDFANSRRQETADSFCDRPHKFSSVAMERSPAFLSLLNSAEASSPTAARN